MRRVDVLWLVEHLAREMDAACAATALLRERHGIETEIWHMYRDAEHLLHTTVPDVVVHPFFYFATGALATEDFVTCWPTATHFNLAWEQLHYPAHQAIKAPADRFTRNRVLHHAWGPFYRDYLTRHGVPAEHVFVNGNPAYALYSEPYRRSYQTRSDLARRYALDPDARWIFVPENYRWAFVSDKRLATIETWGGDRTEAAGLRAYSQRALRSVLHWCADVADRPDLEVIFRTRPSTGEEQMAEIVREELGSRAAPIRFIKRESVREWILAGDVVISSYSTSLIEAALAGKPTFMMEPAPIPPGLACDWYEMVPSLTNGDEFRHACHAASVAETPLADWARREMLGSGDPIVRLADHVADLACARRSAGSTEDAATTAATTARRLPPRTYFNARSHDQDEFDQTFVESRIAAFTRILADGERD